MDSDLSPQIESAGVIHETACKLILTCGVMLLGCTLGLEGFCEVPAELKRRYIHGIPREVLKNLSTNRIPDLLAGLKDTKQQEWWPNIVAGLGAIGDDTVVDELVRFVPNGVEGEASSKAVTAFLCVPIALGNIASRGSEKAVEQLRLDSQPSEWKSRRFTWQHKGRAGHEYLAADSMRFSIYALGISAHPKAIKDLKEMLALSGIEAERKEQITKALKIAREIMRKGREEALRIDAR